MSSKLKLVASGEHTPLPPGTLTAWETHVTLKSHLQGFCSGGQISLRFELLRPQVRPGSPSAAARQPAQTLLC